ncbi:MAG: sigma-70 family RNA polymerase sigma factor [Pseudomonadota bacterium]
MDRDRVEALYRTYGGQVYRRALRLLGDPDAAETALQEVFVRVLRCLDRYREEERVQHWLFRITTNFCLDRRRARARRPVHVDLEERQASPGGDPAAAAAARQILERVIGEGGRRRRIIACLYHLDGMSQERIAEVTGLSRRTVGKHLKCLGVAARTAAEGNP